MKARCIFSPDTDESQIKCYTDIAGVVPCNRAHYGRNIVRNVPCICWLRFNYRPGMFSRKITDNMEIMEIRYTLYSVIGVDSDNLEFAYSAVSLVFCKQHFESISALESASESQYVSGFR